MDVKNDLITIDEITDNHTDGYTENDTGGLGNSQVEEFAASSMPNEEGRKTEKPGRRKNIFVRFLEKINPMP